LGAISPSFLFRFYASLTPVVPKINLIAAVIMPGPTLDGHQIIKKRYSRPNLKIPSKSFYEKKQFLSPAKTAKGSRCLPQAGEASGYGMLHSVFSPSRLLLCFFFSCGVKKVGECDNPLTRKTCPSRRQED
jgi:hypothetical protein